MRCSALQHAVPTSPLLQQQEVKYPDYLSPECRDFLNGLLQKVGTSVALRPAVPGVRCVTGLSPTLGLAGDPYPPLGARDLERKGCAGAT